MRNTPKHAAARMRKMVRKLPERMNAMMRKQAKKMSAVPKSRMRNRNARQMAANTINSVMFFFVCNGRA